MDDIVIVVGHSENFDKDFIEIGYRGLKIKLGLFDSIPYDFQIVDKHLVILKDCQVVSVTKVDSVGELVDKLIYALAQHDLYGDVFMSDGDDDDNY